MSAFEIGNLLVFVDRPFGRLEYEIGIGRRMGPSHVAVATSIAADGTITWETQDPMATIPPLLRLDRDVLGALAAALADVQPPSSAMQKHLDDAIGVRDRLLVLIESGILD